MSLKCWTAPGVVFESREALHEHYKSEWHKYNLKRKVANMQPIPKSMFDKLQVLAAERESAKTAQVKGKDHIKHSKRVPEGAEPLDAAAPAPPGEEGAAADDLKASDAKAGGAAEEEETNDYEVDEEEMKKPVDPRKSFMDGHVAEDLAENLVYMQKYFGFFVPDAEYCADLEGLYRYCTKKVHAGKLCLFCDRPFRSAESAVQHMVSKSHCKIPWDAEEDFDEYEEFFDYSALEAKEAAAKEAGEGTNVELLDSGELIMTDQATGKSRRIGHRDFRHTYKQRLRPEESRPAILAATKERLLLAYQRAGVDPSDSTALSRPMYNGGRPAWMDKKLARQQRTALHFKARRDMRDGKAINLVTKNRLRQHKMDSVGIGVHG